MNIHGTPIFDKEISFTVEMKQFLKAMQFRLKSYMEKNQKVYFTPK